MRPLWLRKYLTPSFELPPSVAGFPKEYLIGNPRPVLMKDFFDEELVRTIHRKPRSQASKWYGVLRQSVVPI